MRNNQRRGASSKDVMKVLGLIHKREKQINPRLYWFMFQKIYLMYHNTSKKEARNYVIVLTSMSDNIPLKKIDRVETHGLEFKG